MIGRRSLLAGAAALSVSARALAAESSRIVVSGATWLRPDQPPREDTWIEIESGLVVATGTGGASTTGTLIDAKGKVVTAGFVDLLTQVGVVSVDLERTAHDDADDRKDPVRAAFRTADGYDPAAAAIAVARREGLTSVGVKPSGGLVAGQSAWADLSGDLADEALATRSMALHVNTATWLGDGPSSIGAVMRRLREVFEDARWLAKNRAAYEKNQSRKLSAERLDLDVVTRAQAGKLPVVFTVDRASDIVTVLEFAHAEKLRAVLASVAEGWKVAPAIARAKVPCIVHPLAHGPHDFDSMFSDEANAGRLAKAGVPVVLSTGETHNARKLRQEAGNAIRAGLSPSAALDGVTRAAARAMGLDDRYGSLEKGKVANLVVWSGDPFELSTRAEHVIIRGRETSLKTRQTALFDKYR